ncbi:hypothetical protein GRAN_5044 [Granulicella sibirica]|uniref:Uncharacterized protein n=1 Tax=Granulicella sibirica TaxID=2479048 RepID=A0A4Q0ST41_9BACT|nr:hypothetical protein GRAN_5044 [Granulicella sibirica]
MNGLQVGIGLPKWLSHLLLHNGGNDIRSSSRSQIHTY